MDTVLIIIGVVVVATIVWALMSAASSRDKVRTAQIELDALPGFKADQTVLKAVKGPAAQGVAIDRSARTLCLIDGAEKRVIPFADLVAVELLIDGDTVTKTSRGGQLVGMAAGGLLAGGVGAIVGGLSASTTAKRKVTDVTLKLLVNDVAKPTHAVHFVPGQVPQALADAAIKEAAQWVDVLKVVLHQNEAYGTAAAA